MTITKNIQNSCTIGFRKVLLGLSPQRIRRTQRAKIDLFVWRIKEISSPTCYIFIHYILKYHRKHHQKLPLHCKGKMLAKFGNWGLRKISCKILTPLSFYHTVQPIPWRLFSSVLKSTFALWCLALHGRMVRARPQSRAMKRRGREIK